MDWQGIGAAIGGLGALFGGVRRFSGKADRMRTRIEHDVQLREKLAPSSAGWTMLANHIDQSVRALVELEQDQDKRRTDPYGLIWLVIFVGIGAAVGITAFRNKYDWWIELILWVVVAVFALFTLVGATVTFRQKPKE